MCASYNFCLNHSENMSLLFFLCVGLVQPISYGYHNLHSEEHHEPQQYHSASVEQIGYGQQQSEGDFDSSGLVSTENFPSNKHTQVVFPTTTSAPYHNEHDEHEHSQYVPPSSHVSQIHTYKAPLVYHKLEHLYDQYGHQNYDDQSDIQHHDENEGISNYEYFESKIDISFRFYGTEIHFIFVEIKFRPYKSKHSLYL